MPTLHAPAPPSVQPARPATASAAFFDAPAPRPLRRLGAAVYIRRVHSRDAMSLTPTDTLPSDRRAVLAPPPDGLDVNGSASDRLFGLRLLAALNDEDEDLLDDEDELDDDDDLLDDEEDELDDDDLFDDEEAMDDEDDDF